VLLGATVYRELCSLLIISGKGLCYAEYAQKRDTHMSISLIFVKVKWL